MESTRQKKISRLLQKECAEMFQQEMRELTLNTMLSITIARVSSDLSLVKFYISVFPSEKIDAVLKNINDNKSRVRYALGQRIGKQLRIVPEPAFFIDDSLDYLEHIDNLLDSEKKTEDNSPEQK
ncbi:MAG: 30S ribosome-binding factor RbfA [Bacteroidales bacterium]|nr:30S ribosome-binding factor RbfA [Bacteroidales bacterium]